MKTEQYYLALVVGAHKLCVPISYVIQVTGAASLLPVPRQGFALLGLLEIGGRFVAVISCHQLLGLEPITLNPSQRYVILYLRPEKQADVQADLQLALHVDEVAGLLAHENCQIEELQLPVGPATHSYGVLSHATGKYWLFDLDQLLQGVDIELIEQLAYSD